MNNKETKITKDDIDLILTLELINSQILDLKKEIKEIHAYLFGGDIISPMGNGSLRQRIVKGVKDALA